MPTIKRYIGRLEKTSNGNEDDLLGLHVLNHKTEILAELIEDNMAQFGHYLSARYYISDKETTFEEVEQEYFKILIGAVDYDDVRYHVVYSELTGYLWTDEDIKIGGHDLLGELKNSNGKYLYLEITYNRNAPEKEE